ncbi:MAG: MoaD/ThiS family protein [Anaerolineales bacterium]|jgi:molybdopterin converting factor small subunit|nr:MoaD/ThiS family protein [Anaerolineales bacterium]|tara:strand:+ start:43372 stop:43653 length:282 start_codon:yes stop_codon:yes gene_type:complete
MRIHVRFAGYYRTLAECASLDLELTESATIDDALVRLNEMLDGRFTKVFSGAGVQRGYPTFLTLVDFRIVDRKVTLREDNVMAIVPPMAGGCQ